MYVAAPQIAASMRIKLIGAIMVNGGRAPNG